MSGHNKGKTYAKIESDTDELILKGLVADAVIAKTRNKGKLPHGYIRNIITKYSSNYPFLKKDLISNRIRQFEKDINKSFSLPQPVQSPPDACAKVGQPVGTTDTRKQEDSSSSVSIALNTNEPESGCDFGLPHSNPPSTCAKEYQFNGTTHVREQDNSLSTSIAMDPIEKVNANESGHSLPPSGTTNKRRRENSLAITVAMNTIVSQLMKERNESESGKKRLRKGRMKEVIEDVKQKMNIPESEDINMHTIKHRLKKGTIFVPHNTNFGGHFTSERSKNKKK